MLNALEAGNKQAINLLLKDFKQPNGAIYFPALFSIPSDHRLPELAKKDYQRASTAVGVGLTLSFESMNLKNRMTGNQIIDLSDTILETSAEDNLSLEDVVLFLQKLTWGEYGPLYESMDIPKFMEKFEIYREERFQTINQIREEQAAQHKTSRVDERLGDMFPNGEKDRNREALKLYMQTKKPE